MSEVYVIFYEEAYEGYGIAAIFLTEEEARDALDGLPFIDIDVSNPEGQGYTGYSLHRFPLGEIDSYYPGLKQPARRS